MQQQKKSVQTGQAVKKTLFIFALLAAAVSSRAQFTTKTQLNNFIRDSLSDKKGIKAFTVRKILNGIADLYSTNYLFTSRRTFGAAVEFKRTVITANTTLDSTHYYVAVNAVSAAVTVTLPSAATCTGRQYFIKKIDSTLNYVTIACTGAETIETINPIYLGTQWQYLWVIAGTTGWEILGALD